LGRRLSDDGSRQQPSKERWVRYGIAGERIEPTP
jgi:hypothetical protein